MKKERSVAVIIENNEGKILLLQRGEGASHYRGKWESVGGKVDDNETPLQTAKREVKEEIAVDVEIIETLFEAEDYVEEIDTLFEETVFKGKILDEPVIQEPHKCSGLMWYTKNELKYLDLSPYTQDDAKKLGWFD
mgnify:CR=1 FL=1